MTSILYSLTSWDAPAAARRLKNPVAASESALEAGRASYSEHCKSCHGENGNGKGERAAELSVMPTDFTDAREMNRLTDGELFWKITRGRRPMPAFEDKLNETQRWQLVDYIRTFASRSR
jgi:mono/diheme cytochrome c family protein